MSPDPLDLLQTFVNARGPCGDEAEVRALCRQRLAPLVDEVWTDAAGNVIGKLAGAGPGPAAPAVRVVAHMDELSLIAKRINEDGSLRVERLGGMYPFSFGRGPVDILGDGGILPGVLSFGSLHVTRESPGAHRMIPKEARGLGETPAWEDVRVITRQAPAALAAAGVHAGSRVVVAQSRRGLQVIEDCVAGYFMDDRAPLCAMLHALAQLQRRGTRPARDVYFIASSTEEIGGGPASYTCRLLPGELTLALDVGPVAQEYGIVLSADPVVVYRDAVGVYDKPVSDELVRVGRRLGMQPQCAVLGGYGSDASLAQSRGQAAQAALLCLPVENTHGYEILHRDSIARCGELLAAFLQPGRNS
jgi:putative aminopeptidase FrvX